MVDGVHGNTTSPGPAVALGSELITVSICSPATVADIAYLVLGTRGLEEGLVGTSTTSDDTNHTTAGRRKDLLGAGGELDTGLALIGVVANDGNVVTGGTAERTTVTGLVLDVGEDGTLRDGVEGQDVADGESGVLSGVDELLRVSYEPVTSRTLRGH